MSHSPGPWIVEEKQSYYHIRTHYDPPKDHCVGWEVAKVHAPADARLIAAAPDLLAIARRVHAEYGPIERKASLAIWWACKCGRETRVGQQASDIKHANNCLWLAAEAVLTKAGEAKP